MKTICTQCNELKTISLTGTICHQCKKINLGKVLDSLREERNDAISILSDIIKNHNHKKPIFLEIAKANALIIQIKTKDKYQNNR